MMIADFYAPFVGGVEVLVRNLSTELACRGHRVAVATTWVEGLSRFEVDGDVRVHRIHTTPVRARWLLRNAGRPWAPPIPDPAASLGLWRVVRRERPEVVHGHDWLARSFIPLKRGAAAPLAMSLHYYTLTCAKKNLLYLGAPCAGPGLVKCLRCASEHYGRAKGPPIVLGNFAVGAAERAAVDMFLPVSYATAKRNGLVGSGLPFDVIPNFVPDRLAGSHHDVDRYLARLPDETFLLFVGDLSPHKGIDVLLLAYGMLADPPPLVLIGKVWADTPTTLPPRVTVLEDWPNEAVREAQRRSIAMVVPSLWFEPFGIVIIEAMAAGCPVIASRMGGIPDLIADGETGFLVPPGNPAALAGAMERLLHDRELRARMRARARTRAEQFRAAAVVPRFEAVYTRLLENYSVRDRPRRSRER